jgi:hypothetical protein
MSLTPTHAAMVRKLVALATDLRGHQGYLVDRRHELMAMRLDRQRRLQQAERQWEAAGGALGSAVGGERDDPLAAFEQQVNEARGSLERVGEEIQRLDGRIGSVARDTGEAARLADRILGHQGLDADLQRVARHR